ncbi:MAG: Hpt domain-containing protein [Anaerolineales bacterium]
MPDLSAYRDLYIQEAGEHMATLRQSLVVLAGRSDPQPSIRLAFEAAHALKGISLAMNFTEPATLAAELEDYLARALEKELEVNANVLQVATTSLEPAIEAALS